MGKWSVSALFYTIIEMLLMKLCLILVFLMLLKYAISEINKL